MLHRRGFLKGTSAALIGGALAKRRSCAAELLRAAEELNDPIVPS